MNARQFLKAIGLLVIVAASVGSLGCHLIGKQPITNPLPPKPEYDPKAAAPKLRPGDQISVRLDTATGREEHQKTVDENGAIDLPFVGKITVMDKTVAEAQEDVRKAYVPRYYHYLTVTIQLTTQRVVYITGEVKSPAPIPYRDDLTVYRAIMQAGGFSEFADRRHVVLTR
ncbi:MAG: polysaccharide biosynthesis/export family protein, partial [Verrucomicrobiae bacterium]|nr:polysaccharide biosynthesis/export family protein [Verrucomicrobiae bacterium]